MKYAASGEEMRRVDACNINELGIPGIVLMERAALSMADVIRKRFDNGKSVVVVAEKGNNGGDGLALGRMLLEAGFPVSFYEIGAIPKATDSYMTQKKILENLSADFTDTLPGEDPDICIDGIFGVGLKRDVAGKHKEIIEEINKRGGYKIAVDIPSGVSATDGKIMGAAFQADLTITFGMQKIGLLLYPGADRAGEIIVTDIGFTAESVRRNPPGAFFYTKEDLARLPKRKAWSNKGSYGKVLLVAGSYNMAGAAVLAGRAAYRTGSGLVRILTPECNRLIIQEALPDAILSTWREKEELAALLKETAAWADVIGIGPGLSQEDSSFLILREILSHGRVPLVIDADGLNVMAKLFATDEDFVRMYESYPCGIILTPHLMEMARLLGRTLDGVRDDLIGTAKHMADKDRIIVLKDARTIVADGTDTVYINVSGNQGMSVGGSGDVLTGIICGLAAQGAAPGEAARLGVYCHGLAGDHAAVRKGYYGLMASDLPEYLSEVLTDDNGGE